MIQRLLIGGYLFLLGVLACYGFYRYHLLWLYYRVKSHRPPVPPAPTVWPSVTIQIPVYNERYVVERAIRSACEVDYPKDRLEIQILDDSTDDTAAIISRTIAPYQQQGIRVVHLQREERSHFKAGALAEGLIRACGDFLAVFDVDFVIPPDFLARTVPHFTDPTVGMVQTRWGHVNTDYSLLTKSQAMLLDGHFVIEQVARHQAGRFFNFNGTAGIWRKSAVLDAGGWQADTLTEDLDLSYRAQLAGWRGVFLPDVVVPAELPVEMNAFKAQQYRWTKGTLQTAKKLLPRLLRSRLPLALKVEAFFHLTSYLSYPLGFLASLCLPPLLMGVLKLPHSWYVDAVWCVLLAIPGGCFYLCTEWEAHPDWRKRLAMVPWAVAVGIGLSVNNALAALDGLWGRRASTFIRTAKFGIQSKTDQWVDKGYRTPPTPVVWVELALAAYFAFGFLVALHHKLFLALPSVALFCASFVYVGGLSLWQRRALHARLLDLLGVESVPEQA